MSDIAPSAPASAPASSSGNSSPSTPSSGGSGGSVSPVSTPSGKSAPVTTKAPVQGATKLPGQPASEAAPPPGMTAAERRQYKGKVDKQERVWELSDDEVAIRLQKSEAAEARFQEAALIKKQWAELQKLAKEDPSLLLKELAGVDPNEWAVKKAEEKWKLEVMPEHERKVYELEQQLLSFKAREAKLKEAAELQAKTQAEQAYEAQIETELQEAFKISGLEWTPDNLEEFGKLIMASLDQGFSYTPAQIAAEGKARIAAREAKYQAQAREKILGMKGDDILGFLGDDVVKEILRAAVAKHQPKAVPSALETPVSPANAGTKTQDRDDKGKFRTTADWRKDFRSRR